MSEPTVNFGNLYDYAGKSGIVLPQTDDIKANIELAFKQTFGDDFSVSEETPAGRLIEALTMLFVDVLGVNAQNANSFNVRQAFGSHLDALGIIFGIARLANESDSAYRDRILQSQSPSTGYVQSIRNAISKVNGVVDCRVFEKHGELTGLMVIRKYHEMRGDTGRTKIIVPDSAHGTNPASAAVCGLQIVQVKSTADGTVDVEDLKPLLGDDIAGMMMTNPNTLGIFEKKIPEIARLVHECGGLMYYDGANLNPMLGVCRPGDMGFDVMHINLHKTFSTPHGGGGPGSGPVGVRAGLEEYLPNPQVVKNADGSFSIRMNEQSLGAVSPLFGNYAVVVRAYAYLLSLGKENVPLAGKLSVLNANYIKECLKEYYKLPIDGLCKHEFVFDGLREEYGGDHHDAGHVTTLDVAKRLLDYGFHAPTIYFPLLFHEAMMIEPTETESKDTLDEFIEVMKTIAIEARDNREMLKTAPHSTPVRRLDDVKAVKEPKFTYAML